MNNLFHSRLNGWLLRWAMLMLAVGFVSACTNTPALPASGMINYSYVPATTQPSVLTQMSLEDY